MGPVLGVFQRLNVRAGTKPGHDFTVLVALRGAPNEMPVIASVGKTNPILGFIGLPAFERALPTPQGQRQIVRMHDLLPLVPDQLLVAEPAHIQAASIDQPNRTARLTLPNDVGYRVN